MGVQTTDITTDRHILQCGTLPCMNHTKFLCDDETHIAHVNNIRIICIKLFVYTSFCLRHCTTLQKRIWFNVGSSGTGPGLIIGY